MNTRVPPSTMRGMADYPKISCSPDQLRSVPRRVRASGEGTKFTLKRNRALSYLAAVTHSCGSPRSTHPERDSTTASTNSRCFLLTQRITSQQHRYIASNRYSTPGDCGRVSLLKKRILVHHSIQSAVFFKHPCLDCCVMAHSHAASMRAEDERTRLQDMGARH